MGRVCAGGREREIDAAQLELLDGFRVIGQLPGWIDLHLVPTLGVLFTFLPKNSAASCRDPPGYRYD